MKIIRGFAILVAFLALGEGVSMLIGNFVPGSVCGMILLFAALCLGLVKSEWIRECADFLTDNMTLLFIPAFMGILDQWELIKMNWLGWLIVTVVTTVLVLASSGLCVELIDKIRRK